MLKYHLTAYIQRNNNMPSPSVGEGVSSTKSEDDNCIVSEESRGFKQFMHGYIN